MKNCRIFSGSSHEVFAADLAKNLKVPLGKISRKKFQCGEYYIRFDESLRGKEVFLVQTGRTDEMNEDIMELILMIDAAKQSFAKSIHVVLPYTPYSRQDKIHEPREGISAKIFAKILETAGANHVIATHLHSAQMQGFFNIPVDNINPAKLFVEYFKSKTKKESVIVSPDVGGAKTAKKFADELGLDLIILHKTRPAHNTSEVTEVIGNVEGRCPIIIDDIVDSGGSVVTAKKALIQNGAKDDVSLCVTHAVFSGEAVDKIDHAGFTNIICTDSLPLKKTPKNFAKISLIPLMADTIKNIATQKSVSALY